MSYRPLTDWERRVILRLLTERPFAGREELLAQLNEAAARSIGNRHRKRTHLGAEKGPTCARLYPAGKVAGTTHLVFPFRLLMDSLKR